MNEFQVGVLVYVPLQLGSLALLPRWWRLAALPALIAAPGIFFHDGYMGDVFATVWMFDCSKRNAGGDFGIEFPVFRLVSNKLERPR